MKEIEFDIEDEILDIVDGLVENGVYETRDEFIIEAVKEEMKQVVSPTSTTPFSNGHEDFFGNDILVDVRTYAREAWQKEKHDLNQDVLEPGIYLESDDEITVYTIVLDVYDLEKVYIEEKIDELNEKFNTNIEVDWNGFA